MASTTSNQLGCPSCCQQLLLMQLRGLLMPCTVALLTAGYAAQSLLAAIGCVQFVSNVLFASWVLKEQVGGQPEAPLTASCRRRCSPLSMQAVFARPYPL